MAIERDEHGHFKPGFCPNPEGRGFKTPEVLKPRSIMSLKEIREIGSIIFRSTHAELRQIAADPNEKALLRGWAACYLKAWLERDFRTIDIMANRIGGRVKEQIEHHLPRVKIIETLSGDQIRLETDNDTQGD